MVVAPQIVEMPLTPSTLHDEKHHPVQNKGEKCQQENRVLREKRTHTRKRHTVGVAPLCQTTAVDFTGAQRGGWKPPTCGWPVFRFFTGCFKASEAPPEFPSCSVSSLVCPSSSPEPSLVPSKSLSLSVSSSMASGSRKVTGGGYFSFTAFWSSFCCLLKGGRL